MIPVTIPNPLPILLISLFVPAKGAWYAVPPITFIEDDVFSMIVGIEPVPLLTISIIVA